MKNSEEMVSRLIGRLKLNAFYDIKGNLSGKNAFLQTNF